MLPWLGLWVGLSCVSSQWVVLSAVGAGPESADEGVLLRFCASGAICSVSDWLSVGDSQHEHQCTELILCWLPQETHVCGCNGDKNWLFSDRRSHASLRRRLSSRGRRCVAASCGSHRVSSAGGAHSWIWWRRRRRSADTGTASDLGGDKR